MKEITLSASQLKQALPGLSKVIGRRTTLPVLQTIRLSRSAEGHVTLQGTDLDSFVTYTAKETSIGPVTEMLVPMDQLAKTVKTLTANDPVCFTPDGEDKLKLRYPIGGSTVERIISTVPVGEFPAAPSINQPAVALEPGFGLALRQALGCCSEDYSRQILKGAFLDVRDDKFHYVIGTNGRALFSANSFCFDLQKSVIIPDSKFLEWSDFMGEDEPATLAVEPGQKFEPAKRGKVAQEARPGWLKLASGNWTFITKEIEGEYPNWKQVIPQNTDKWTRVNLSGEAIAQIIRVLPSLPGDDNYNRPIRLRVDRYLSIEGRNRDDKDWTSIPIQNVTVTGKPAMVGLCREYLLTALRYGLNQLEIEDALSPVILSKEGKRMVIAPYDFEGPARVATAPQPTSPSTTTAPQPVEQVEQPASQATSEPPTEERTDEMRTARTTAPEAAPRETVNAEAQHGSNNGSSNAHESNGANSAVKSVIEHVEQIKDSLKGLIRDLSTIADMLKQAEKEKRVTDKEIESIRGKLRQIQNVNI